MRAVVGDNRSLRPGILFFDFPDLVLRHVDRGENEVHVLRNGLYVVDVTDHDILHILRNLSVQLPAAFYRFSVGLPCAAGARCDLSDLEPGMVLENLNEALADHSGSAQNTDSEFLHNFLDLLICVRTALVPADATRFVHRYLRTLPFNIAYIVPSMTIFH